jgi:4-amino-4-deoxy-L-arabinose transferase-like glycosyltransferase
MGDSRARKSLFAFAVFAYGTLVSFVAVFVVLRSQHLVDTSLVDLNGFGAIARHLARGDGFSLGFGPTIRRAPLYPLLGAALLSLFSRDYPGISQVELFRPLLIANCVAVGLTCLTVRAIANRIFGSRAGLLAAAICPLVPQCLRYVGMTEVETIMGLFIALLALTGLDLVSRPTLRSAIAFAVTAAAATLTKPVALIYPFIFLGLAGWHWKRAGLLNRSALYASGAGLVCFLALLAPASLRNMAVTEGQFKGISSNGPGEFLRGYVNVQPKYFLLQQDFGGSGPGEKWDPEANTFEMKLLLSHGMPFYRYIYDASGETVLDPPPPPTATSAASLEVAKDKIESAEVKRVVMSEPLGFVRKFVIQIFTFWYVVETRVKSVLVGVIALAILALASVGFVRARRNQALVWPVVAVIVYFNALYAVFLAFARYSMPLFPALVSLSAGGLISSAERLFRRPAAAPAARSEAA